MMRIDVIRKSATVAVCSGMLVGFVFAVGCSERPTSGNKMDDPELKANMKKIGEQFKTKMQEMKSNNPKTGSSKGFRRP
jgi:hypothetical protein